ncbi:hypothetical protein NDU88_003661 [Pleurodeles waltl]|uniref:Uncharacterized protein n=1 Tax=Pleurodeles waltl TaxID=8319 RepID=A0AAV7M7Q1_PLEWA|nr:hypothetical protein NDU88_003661 [Pleurodeles waltl]
MFSRGIGRHVTRKRKRPNVNSVEINYGEYEVQVAGCVCVRVSVLLNMKIQEKASKQLKPEYSLVMECCSYDLLCDEALYGF